MSGLKLAGCFTMYSLFLVKKNPHIQYGNSSCTMFDNKQIFDYLLIYFIIMILFGE